MNLKKIIRRDLQDFCAYSSARKEADNGTLWLDANESPWESGLNRYPEPQPVQLRSLCASYYGVNSQNLLLTRGSDEAIDLLIRFCCEPGYDNILICPPTYGMYSVSANLQGASCISVPLLKAQGFAFDRSGIIAASTQRVKIIFLCSPNNPTGNVLEEQELLQLMQCISPDCLTVIDEAYIEFSSQISMARFVQDFPNLVILRTFSKAFGLAGARCGCLIADTELIAGLSNIIAPYPLPTPTIQAVTNALSPDNLQLLPQKIATLINNRDYLAMVLSSCPWVKKVYPSEANYLLLECDNANRIYTRCLEKGVVLRNMNGKFNLDNCLRITLGTDEQMEILINTLERL